MAKRAEKEPIEPIEPQKIQLPTHAEYTKYRKKQKAAKAEMDEAKGRMGGNKEQAIVSCNLHSDADRIAAKYLNKSPAQQAEFLLHFEAYWEYLKLATPDDDLVEKPDERKGKLGSNVVNLEQAEAS